MNIKKLITFIPPKTVVFLTVLFLATLFVGIVSIERLPGVLVDTDVPHEWLMFGTYKISLVDDITHGISGIAGFIALILGHRARVKYLMTIGGYYALDALFFLVYGVFIGTPIFDNVMLNGPHVGITVLVVHALYRSVKKIELNVA